jgi:hypothetical protein
METKVCSNCKIEKSLDDFLWKNKSKNLKHSRCGECYKEIRKKSYEKNKDYYLKKNVRLRKHNAEWYIDYKNDKSCLVCGESESVCLDFHHLNGKDKDFSVSNMMYSTYSKEKIMKEIEKCVILCSNCHRKVHANIIILPS